jgi:flagellar basal body rod protein FlgF
MKEETSLNRSEREFLFQLYQQTNGDQSRQIESATIGISLGLDRSSSRKISEELMGHGFVAVKTLSGGIGITADGLAEAMRLGNGAQTVQPILGKSPVIGVDECEKMEKALMDLKKSISQSHLDYDAMAQIVIDMKTMEVQLLSPKPKTGIIKACLRSMNRVLKLTGESECVNIINNLIGES